MHIALSVTTFWGNVEKERKKCDMGPTGPMYTVVGPAYQGESSRW